MAGNTVYVQGSYVDVHDNEVVNLSIDKATVQLDSAEHRQQVEVSTMVERHVAYGETSVEAPKQDSNYFAPTKNLQELLRQPWFKEVRTRAEYSEQWTDSLVRALMASEWKDDIARDWSVQGKRKKINQIKASVVGLLVDAGVLKGSYDSIAAKADITEDPRSFSRYMGKGKKQPYADWLMDYVRGQM